MNTARFIFSSFVIAIAVAGCGGGGGSSAPLPSASPSPAASGTPSPTPAPSSSPTPAPSPSPSPAATPLLIHIGFELGEHTDPVFGPIWYYSTGNSAQVIQAVHGTTAQFVNDDPGGSPHTASGLGTGGFPAGFDNTGGFTQTGSTIDGSLTWSTGTLNHGAKSQIFTIGPPGHYYFGCNYHYTVPPTPSNQSMGDVLVST